MFRKIRDKIITIEVVLDALVTILHKKRVVTRDEIQAEILDVAMRGHRHGRS